MRRSIFAFGLVGVVAALLLFLGLRRGAEVPLAAPGATVHGGAGRLSVAAAATAGPSWLSQAGAPGRRVGGRVSYAGAPAAGATIHLALAGDLGRIRPPLVRISDADGRFDFATFPATEIVVTASARGRAPAGVALDLRDPAADPAPDQIELELTDCAHTVFGTVRDAASGPIAGATVRAASRAARVSAVTGDDGGYELCVQAGGVWLSATAEGYGRAIAQVDAARRARRDLELAPAVAIEGLVVDADDRPVAGALVTATATEWSTFMFDVGASPAISDEQGHFSIDGVGPGRYAVAARDRGRASGEPVEVVARVGEAGEAIVLRLVPIVILAGRVVEGGRPVAGATVSPERSWRSRRPAVSAVSQADGRFELDGVAPGSVALEVAGYEVVAPRRVAAALPTTEVTLEVAAKARIRGRVTRGGQPAAGAAVHATGKRGQWGGRTISRSDGRYEIDDLDAGTYQVGGENAQVDAFAANVPVTVARGEVRDGVDLELDLAGSIAGVVVDQRGAPVAGVLVRVSLEGGQDWGNGTTEDDGSFVAGALSGGGVYRVVVKPSSMSPIEFKPAGAAWAPIAVHDGSSAVTGVRVAIVLDRQTIRGKVVRAGGAPVPDVRVKAMVADEREEMQRWMPPAAEAITAADGGFVLRDLIAGTYTVAVNSGASGGAEQEGVAAGQRGVVLTLPEVGGIEGRLIGFTGAPVVEAMADRGEGMPGVYRARVDGDRFVLRDLAPGTYQVSARAGAAADRAEVEVEGGKTATVELESEGTAKIRGRVIDFVSRQPIAGLACRGVSGGGDEGAVESDGQGRFELVVAARQELYVHCHPAGAWTLEGGWASRSLEPIEPGVTKDVELAMVRRTHDGERGDAGLDFTGPAPATIADVVAGGPGAVAGIVPGDVVVAVDGLRVEALEAIGVSTRILDRPIGQRASLAIRRDGGERTVEVEIGPRSEERQWSQW